jgi:hypothetical protein
VGAGSDSHGNGGARPKLLVFRDEADATLSGESALDGIGAGFAWVERTPAGRNIHALPLDANDHVATAATIHLGGPSLTIPAGRACRQAGTRATIDGTTLHLAGAEFPVAITIATDTGWVSFDTAVPADILALSLRYFFPQSGPTGLGALRYPVVDGGTGKTVSITGAFNPARPGDATTGLKITAGATVYRTNFRTNIGHTITLSPIAGRSEIGFQWDPQALLFYHPEEGEYSTRGEDTMFLNALYATVPVASLIGHGYLYLYTYHGRNTFSKEHHHHLSTYSRTAADMLGEVDRIREALSHYPIEKPVVVGGRDGPSFVL